jgi:hypothetical protein
MEGTERELFARSLRHALESGRGGDVLDGSLGGLGWHEALVEDPRTAVSVLFELQGAAGAHSSALPAVLGYGLGMAPPATAGLVLPRPGHAGPPGTVDRGRLTVHGLAGTVREREGTVVVVAGTGDGDAVADVSVDDLDLRKIDGLAPHLGLVEVVGTDVPYTVWDELPDGRWERGVALARLAVGHQLVGTSRRMLELARRHALERIQFDRPIGSFQAVRHRLADALIAIEGADAALQSAWDDDSIESAAVAKALAGRGARTTARHCQQVLAGIGFTTEHPFHCSLRDTLVLDQLFGTANSLTREFGRRLLATRQLPPLPPL